MCREGVTFQETSKLIKAIQHSLTSNEFSSQNRWENLLLGITYITVLAILPLAVLTDLFAFPAFRTKTENAGQIEGLRG